MSGLRPDQRVIKARNTGGNDNTFPVRHPRFGRVAHGGATKHILSRMRATGRVGKRHRVKACNDVKREHVAYLASSTKAAR